MAYDEVEWGFREGVTSQKLQQMCDNDAYFKELTDRLPRGILARAKLKSNQSSQAIWWDVPGLTCTADYEAQRTIRVSCTWQGIAPWGLPGIWAVRIQSGNDVLAECYVDATIDHLSVGGGSLFTTGVSDTAGSRTWKVSMYRVNSTGTEAGNIFFLASPLGPAELIVEDLGPSTAIQNFIG